MSENDLRLRDRALAEARNGIIISDARQPDNPIVYFNRAFLELTGYSDEILGQNCRFLQGEGTEPDAIAEVRAALRDERECRVTLRNYRKDGVPFWNELTISPVRDEAGRLTHFIGVQADVTARKAWEDERERLLAETRALLAQAQARAAQEAVLSRIVQAILHSPFSEVIQTAAGAILGEALGADRCFYLTLDRVHGRCRIGNDYRRADLPSLAGDYGWAGFGEALEELCVAGGTAALADIETAGLSPALVSLFRSRAMRAILVVPFLHRDAPDAALVLARADGPHDWSGAETALAEAVAAQTRTAVEAARLVQREHAIATQLQNALQPPLPGLTPGLALAKHYEPALTEEAGVGGDFYDVFMLEKGCTALVVGDLSGKGLAAAAQVATVRNGLRTTLHLAQSLAEAVTNLNDILARHVMLAEFATLFVGSYDQEARTLNYVGCGQEPALVRRAATGAVEALPPTGPVLGAFAGAVFAQRAVVLAPGDALAIFTDGLTEVGASRTQMLGIEGVTALFAGPLGAEETADAEETAETLIRRLIEGVNEAARDGVLRDDVCLLVGVVE